MNENPRLVSHYIIIPDLGEALFRGDTQKLRELLSGISVGDIIRTWGLELQVDNPTPEEREWGLFMAGSTHREIRGKTRELDDLECLRVAGELASLHGPKSFSHTHWDETCTPIPSGPDVTMFRILSQEHLGYRFRVISWLPDSKVFEIVGEYDLHSKN